VLGVDPADRGLAEPGGPSALSIAADALLDRHVGEVLEPEAGAGLGGEPGRGRDGGVGQVGVVGDDAGGGGDVQAVALWPRRTPVAGVRW
jgi:hypothetical protein